MCSSIPVPKVYGYCTDREKSGVNAEYILMEKINGEPLKYLWKKMLPAEKSFILEQLAEIYGKIQKITFSQIGSFQLESSIGDTGGIGLDPQQDIEPEHNLVVGKGIDFHGGPCDTYLEYFKSSAKTEIEFLRTCPFMREAEGYEKRLERIENFVAAFNNLESVPESMREAVVDVPFVFTHGDLEPQNILVDEETMKVTGIIDWEFSGASPVDEDWFCSFAFAGSDTSVWRVFNEDPSNGDDCFDQEMLKPLREYFLEQLKTKEVLTPDDIPGHMIRSELFYFKGYICPWWLREKRDPRPERHYRDRDDACNRVDAILSKHGF
ncbi:unnamed protein product [Orchesella dallaii]|uniref:Aminoglycoside phosphotransferase domain-containing protein n=1 Tax=Orchesella dallaii TaxID=48710 RepID=A0ABP1R461_9HEXA